MTKVTKVFVLKFDEPEEGWLGQENLELVLHKMMPNTTFEVIEVTEKVTRMHQKAEEFDALQGAGVDNWEHYGEHCKDWETDEYIEFSELPLPW